MHFKITKINPLHVTINNIFMEKKFSNKIIKRIALLYIFSILLNFWSNKRHLDSHICFHIQSTFSLL